MGVALVSDLSDKIVRYGIPRGFIPGIVKGGPLDRVQQRRTRHAAFLKKVLFAEEIFEFGDVAVFGAVAGGCSSAASHRRKGQMRHKIQKIIYNGILRTVHGNCTARSA